jgi:SpoVK/Ycf46/Vps4 family AAA+-type ATPase
LNKESGTNPVGEIQRFVIARYPIIYITSWEEDRVERTLKTVASSFAAQKFKFYSWTSTIGLTLNGQLLSNTQNPLELLDHIIRTKENALFLLKDFHPFLKDPKIVRKLRDSYYYLKNSYKYIFLLSPLLIIPDELKKEVTLFEFALPSYGELQQLFNTAINGYKAKGDVSINITPDKIHKFIRALQGLTLDEAQQALNKILFGRKTIDNNLLPLLYEEKRLLTRKEGLLEFVPQSVSLQDVGGLDNLKEWLLKRQKAFSEDAKKFGISPPRGLLMMGISGCGKSLSVKAISALWDLPLFRLDMNAVFSRAIGSPEEAFNRALKTMESVAPVILWIDEIEMGVAGYTNSSGNESSRIFASFLTWMQEKEALVFVAATANRIDLLPAEVLRKGRFDQIFFLDLPTESERAQIFKVHLEKRNNPANNFNLKQLAKVTKEWNGAEIESCVISAMVDAFNENRQLNDNDLYRAIAKIVPLSTTMIEQIKHIKSWAHDRAIKASKSSTTEAS